MKNFKTITTLFAALSVMFVMGISQATTLTFEKITTNAPEDISSQLFVDINEVYTGTAITGATFSVRNEVVYESLTSDVITSGINSSISEIYFDYSTLANFDSIVISSQTGTDFCDINTCPTNPGVTPGELPGSTFSSEYAADSYGNPENGIDRSTDELIFLATLGDWSYADMLDALANGDFRIGFHIQEIGSTLDSDGYASVSTVPVPAAAWLFGTALFGFFATGRRKKIS